MSYPFLGLHSPPEEGDTYVLQNVVASLVETMDYAQNISHFHGYTELPAIAIKGTLQLQQEAFHYVCLTVAPRSI